MRYKKLGDMNGDVLRTEFPFPEDPDGRLDKILSCVNTELKSTILTICMDSEPRNANDLRYRFMETLKDVAWVPESANFSEYGRRNLVPSGAAAQLNATSNGKRIDFFKITDCGNSYFRPVAAFALQYAVNNGRSMYPLLGRSGSSGSTRSPSVRVSILQSIISGSDRVSDLGLKQGNIHRHLEALNDAGLIVYETKGAGDAEGWAVYEWVDGKEPADLAMHGRHRNCNIKVAQYLCMRGSADYRDVSNGLEIGLDTVSRALVTLAEAGFATCKFTCKKKTDLKPLGFGRDFYENFIVPVEKHLADEDSIVPEVAVHVEENLAYYASRGVGLYTNASPSRQVSGRNENEDVVMSFIRDYQGNHDGPRTTEIARETGLSLGVVGASLKHMLECGKIIRRNGEPRHYKAARGCAVRYSVS